MHRMNSNDSWQDWLYDEGEDANKATYVSKIEELRFVAGPIIQRYQDKIEAQRQEALKKEEEAAAAKRAEEEARMKAEQEAKKAAGGNEDEEMTDTVNMETETNGAVPGSVEEPGEGEMRQ